MVWISPSFRDEHREALTLLNDLGADRVRFFGVELGVIKIGDSAPAPHLQLRAEPNDWHAQASAAARGSSQSSGVGVLYKNFWERYLERVSVEHPDWTNAKTPQPRHVFNLPAPFKSLSIYGNVFNKGGDASTVKYTSTRLTVLPPLRSMRHCWHVAQRLKRYTAQTSNSKNYPTEEQVGSLNIVRAQCTTLTVTRSSLIGSSTVANDFAKRSTPSLRRFKQRSTPSRPACTGTLVSTCHRRFVLESLL